MSTRDANISNYPLSVETSKRHDEHKHLFGLVLSSKLERLDWVYSTIKCNDRFYVRSWCFAVSHKASYGSACSIFENNSFLFPWFEANTCSIVLISIKGTKVQSVVILVIITRVSKRDSKFNSWSKPITELRCNCWRLLVIPYYKQRRFLRVWTGLFHYFESSRKSKEDFWKHDAISDMHESSLSESRRQTNIRDFPSSFTRGLRVWVESRNVYSVFSSENQWNVLGLEFA